MNAAMLLIKILHYGKHDGGNIVPSPERIRAVILSQHTGWAAVLSDTRVQLAHDGECVSVPITDIDYIISVLEDAQIRAQPSIRPVR